MMKEDSCIFGKIALILVIIIISVWFFSHFRMGIYSENIMMIEQGYECPGVGFQPTIGGYLGCEPSEREIESTIKDNPRLMIWWKK